MIDLQEEILSKVVLILKMHVPKAQVLAFGSRVNGSSKPYSDLDIAIIDSKKLDLKTLSLLKEAFQESTLPIRIDVVDWHALSDSFRAVIQKGFDVIQEKS